MHLLKPQEERHARDDIAAALSLLPGLGHIYKGYYLNGTLIMLAGIPLMLFVSGLLAFATFGFGTVVPILFWIGIAVQAYYLPDRRKHHPII